MSVHYTGSQPLILQTAYKNNKVRIKTSLLHNWRETCGWTSRKTVVPLILFNTGLYRTNQSSLSYFGVNGSPTGATARSGGGPSITELSRSYSDTPHSLGLLWNSDQPDARTSNYQNTKLSRDRHFHAPGRIRSRNPSNWAATVPHLRLCGHWDRPSDVRGSSRK